MILGILKVGTKKLFVTKDGDARMSEIEPCCVLAGPHGSTAPRLQHDSETYLCVCVCIFIRVRLV